MGLTNPLLPVSVVDGISRKALPPSKSFCSLTQDNLVLSALKKSDLDSSLLLRV
jgi:alpha-mannosidase